jgi:hypothetical protein
MRAERGNGIGTRTFHPGDFVVVGRGPDQAVELIAPSTEYAYISIRQQLRRPSFQRSAHFAHRAIAVVDGRIQRHSTQQDGSGLIYQRPMQLRLIGPTALPGDDPLAGLVHGMSAPHMPALNIGITERFHNSCGVGD